MLITGTFFRNDEASHARMNQIMQMTFRAEMTGLFESNGKTV